MSIVQAVMSTGDTDRRAAIRVPVAARCIARPAFPAAGPQGSLERSRNIRVRDASLGGAFIEWLAIRPSLGSVVNLQLDRPVADGVSARAYYVPATVVRVEPGGVALQFDRLRPSAMSRLLLLSRDQRDSATMKRTDEQIRSDVIRALKDHPRLAGAELGVHVSGGVVTLAGTVGSWGVKMAAQDAARAVAGSTDIRNRIEFRMGEGARLTDADVARVVRRALDRDLPGLESRVSCSVSAGWVTLEGAVDHWKQRGDVERVVRKLTGVLGVANQVEFRSSAPLHDDHQPSTPAW